MREQSPLSWLRLGPGRERRGEPGWTNPATALDVQPVDMEEEDPEMVEALVKALSEADEESLVPSPRFQVPSPK